LDVFPQPQRFSEFECSATITVPNMSPAQTTSMSCKRNVRVSVGHTAEDRMLIEQSFESTEVHTHREDQQQERKCDGEPLPRQYNVPGSQRTGAARDEKEENSAQVFAAKARELVV
jgi:hypothetical protein